MGICPVRHNVRDMVLALERGAVLWSRQNVWDWLLGFGELVLMWSFRNSNFLRKREDLLFVYCEYYFIKLFKLFTVNVLRFRNCLKRYLGVIIFFNRKCFEPLNC